MNDTQALLAVHSPSRRLVRQSLLWGAAMFIASCSDVSRPRPEPAPVQPSVTSSAWPHEPTGATLITDQPFDSRTSLGWAYDSTSLGTPTIVADASAPYTPQNVVEFSYPIGFPGGGWAPGAEWTTLPSINRVFIGTWWKSSNPWQGAGTVLAYLQSAAGHLSLATYGPAGGPYQVYVHGPSDYYPNQTPAVTLSPGTWYQVEMLVDNADPANAHIEWWVSGQLVGNYTNVQLPSDPFTSVRLEPSWGDASSKTENDYVRYDHAYISGNWPTAPSSSLVFEETFAGTTQAYYESRGWYDGTAQITPDANMDGYKFLTDQQLGRNVMYAHWSTVHFDADDKLPGFAWRYCLQGPHPCNASGSAMSSGATAYILFKTHNVMGSPWGTHWTRFGRHFADGTNGNSPGQMDLDIAGRAQKNQAYDPATGQAIQDFCGTGGTPCLIYRTFHYYFGDISWANPNMGGILQDDTWYEMAYYALPGTGDGTSDGALRIVYRPYGTTTWTTVLVGQNIKTAYSTGNITQFLIGPYMDRWTTDIRQYYATIRLYSGNAICDGSIDPSLTC